MASLELYDLAFQFRSVKLWEKLFESEMFAVRFPDGETGYCSVMGALGGHYALAVYVGDRGFASYWRIDQALQAEEDPLRMHELMLTQECLQCSLEAWWDISPEQEEEARAAARQLHRRFQGPHSVPVFTKYEAGRMSYGQMSETDEMYLKEALSASLALKGMLKRRDAVSLGLAEMICPQGELPMLIRKEGEWKMSITRLPDGEIEYYQPEFRDELKAMRIRKRKKKGIWECGTVYEPTPVVSQDSEQAPFFPLVMLRLDMEGFLLEPLIAEYGTEEMVTLMAGHLVQYEFCPREIRCGDERCYYLLKDLCEKTGIRLVKDVPTELLYDAERDFLEFMRESEEDEEIDTFPGVEEVLNLLSAMDDESLGSFPQEMADTLLRLADEGALPEELAERLRRLYTYEE